jgi:hypothetical protein
VKRDFVATRKKKTRIAFDDVEKKRRKIAFDDVKREERKIAFDDVVVVRSKTS